MSEFVVVDASVAFKWLVREEHTDKALAILRVWDSQDIRPAAPYLMPFEVANALHRRITQGELSVEAAADLIGSLLSSRLELHQPPNLHRRALELAGQLKQGAVYDAHYLALAESQGCELWTADQRFVRALGPSVDNVRWIGEFSPPELREGG